MNHKKRIPVNLFLISSIFLLFFTTFQAQTLITSYAKIEGPVASPGGYGRYVMSEIGDKDPLAFRRLLTVRVHSGYFESTNSDTRLFSLPNDNSSVEFRIVWDDDCVVNGFALIEYHLCGGFTTIPNCSQSGFTGTFVLSPSTSPPCLTECEKKQKQIDDLFTELETVPRNGSRRREINDEIDEIYADNAGTTCNLK